MKNENENSWKIPFDERVMKISVQRAEKVFFYFSFSLEFKVMFAIQCVSWFPYMQIYLLRVYIITWCILEKWQFFVFHCSNFKLCIQCNSLLICLCAIFLIPLLLSVSLSLSLFIDAHSCKELHTRSHKYALQNFQQVVGTEEFLLLPFSEVSTNNICIVYAEYKHIIFIHYDMNG